MGFSLTAAQADAVLSALKQDYRVYAPSGSSSRAAIPTPTW